MLGYAEGRQCPPPTGNDDYLKSIGFRINPQINKLRKLKKRNNIIKRGRKNGKRYPTKLTVVVKADLLEYHTRLGDIDVNRAGPLPTSFQPYRARRDSRNRYQCRAYRHAEPVAILEPVAIGGVTTSGLPCTMKTICAVKTSAKAIGLHSARR